MFASQKLNRNYLSMSLLKVSKDDKFCVINQKIFDRIERIKNFKIYEDDIWLITFPKSGTIWAQEMLRLISNDLNYEAAAQRDINEDFPFLESSVEFTDESSLSKGIKNLIDVCERMPRPRRIKSHLPVFLLPDELWTVKPKIVYVNRNPKDVALSYYNQHYYIVGWKITLQEFLDLFLADQVQCSPMNQHVLEFWKKRDEPNVLFLFYEDMKRDLSSVLKKTSQFLGKNFTKEDIEKLCEHLSLDKMKKNPSLSKEKELKFFNVKPGEFSFIRKGLVGGHKEEFSDQMNKAFDEFSNHPDFKKYNFSYKFS